MVVTELPIRGGAMAKKNETMEMAEVDEWAAGTGLQWLAQVARLGAGEGSRLIPGIKGCPLLHPGFPITSPVRFECGF